MGLAPFVADDSLFHHLAEEFRRLVDFPLFVIRNEPVKISSHEQTDIDPRKINEPKRRHARASDERTAQSINLLHGQALVEHRLERVHHREQKYAVGDEVRAVVGINDHFAQPAAAKIADEAADFGIGFRCLDNFHQAHVAGGIKEVRAQPMPSKIVRQSLG